MLKNAELRLMYTAKLILASIHWGNLVRWWHFKQ